MLLLLLLLQYTPNDYVMKVANDNPDHFVAACSVHPFRPDVVAELEKCRKRNVLIIKWLVSGTVIACIWMPVVLDTR